jgi:hypothetical protein
MTMICQICGTRTTLLVGPCIECAAAALPPPTVDIPTEGLMLPAEFRVTAGANAVAGPLVSASAGASAGATPTLDAAPMPQDTLSGMMVLRQEPSGTQQSDAGADHIHVPALVASDAPAPDADATSNPVHPSALPQQPAGSSARWRVAVAATIALGTAIAIVWGSGPSAGGTSTGVASAAVAVPLTEDTSPAAPVASGVEANRASNSAPDAAAVLPSAATGKNAAAPPDKKAKDSTARKPVVAHSSPASASAVPQPVEHPQELTAAVVHPEPVRAAPADPSSSDPRQACTGGNFFSKAVCMNTRCAQPAYSAHDECVRLRKLADDAEMASLRGG